MTRTLVLAAILAALPLSAMAAERFSDQSFLTAARCVAYSEATQLQGDLFNASALKEAVDAQTNSRSRAVRSEARGDARNIRRLTARADTASDIARLRERRDQSCRAYIQNGLVQAGAPTPSS